MSPRTNPRSAVCTAVALLGVSVLVLATALPAQAEPSGPGPVPIPPDLRGAKPATTGVVAPALRAAAGTIAVSVAMSEEPIAAAVAENAVPEKRLPSRSVQRGRTASVTAQQDRMIQRARALGARELGRATKAANVVALRLPATSVTEVAQLPGVVSVKPVGRYELHSDPGGSGSLAQAAKYLQATSVRAAGYDGTGVKIGVLDSGIDFTHAYLGGPGTKAAYEECYRGATRTAHNSAPTGACAALFGPNAPKVKGGYDFVGEAWGGSTNAPLTPDPNPIDAWGHGTHVSDIAAGRATDGRHSGIAPGADVYGIKVCSALSSACSGIAILQGIDYALDPNDDGDLSDAMDIVNLSLGGPYGQAQDETSAALNNLVRAGVVAIASAGNDADRPFIVGSPSTAQRVISVAQTALPDDVIYPIKVASPTIVSPPANRIPYAKLQPWSPAPTVVISAPLAQPVGQEGCTAAAFGGFPAGAVALVRRGTCNASAKAQNAQAAGASAVVLWNNVTGDPPEFSFSGGPAVTVPTLTISQANGERLAAAVVAGAVRVSIDPASSRSARNTMVGSSSRGVSISGQRAKPDIGAPGAWLSAEVGTGAAQTTFGGTSGAAPVVTGAAALVLDRYPDASPRTVKARLLNAADQNNTTFDANANPYPTPISRIGAGEVRIGPAVQARTVLSAQLAGQGNIGLGLPRLTRPTTYPVKLRLSNTSGAKRAYLIRSDFRDRADRRSGAVTVKAPSVVRVPARSTRTFTISVTIKPGALANWPFTHTAGSTGVGAKLNQPEFDGYLRAESAGETVHLGWTVLPHKSADVSGPGSVTLDQGRGYLSLRNDSRVHAGNVNVFGLTGTSARQPRPLPGQPGSPGSNQAVIDLAAAGVRDDPVRNTISFAIAGQQRQTTPLYPAGYEIDLDTDRDGKVDYAIFQQEAVGRGSTGESLVYVLNVATQAAGAYYYTDADFGSSTQVLSAPLSVLGLSRGSTFNFQVLAYDNYFSGVVTDVIRGQTWTVGAEKYALAGSVDSVPVGAGRTARYALTQAPATVSTQTGLLLLYDDARSRDSQAVTVTGVAAAAATTGR